METIVAMFVATWLVGGLLSFAAFRVMRTEPRWRRISLCSLLLATTLAPSVMLGHGVFPVPAILVPFVGPYNVPLGSGYFWQFALPIVVCWILIASGWLLIKREAA